DSENDLWRPDRYELVKKKFSGPDEDSTEVQREQHARVYILIIIGGLLMFDKSRNLIHLRWYLKVVDFREVGELSWGWNHGLSYVGLLDDLRDIQLLLDQQLEAEGTRHLRSDEAIEAGPPSTPTQESTPMATRPPDQYDSTYFGTYTNPVIFTQASHIAPHVFASTLMPGEEDERSGTQPVLEAEPRRNPARNR
ncbi:hypothetical protein Gotur_005671, partial [Gossypium turneri]